MIKFEYLYGSLENLELIWQLFYDSIKVKLVTITADETSSLPACGLAPDGVADDVGSSLAGGCRPGDGVMWLGRSRCSIVAEVDLDALLNEPGQLLGLWRARSCWAATWRLPLIIIWVLSLRSLIGTNRCRLIRSWSYPRSHSRSSRTPWAPIGAREA